jgi:hypothetical protein
MKFASDSDEEELEEEEEQEVKEGGAGQRNEIQREVIKSSPPLSIV